MITRLGEPSTAHAPNSPLMRTSRLFLLLVPIMTALGVSAQASDLQDTARPRQKAACNDYYDQFAAAISAEAWRQLARLAERYNRTCIGVFGAAEDSDGYEQIAFANVELDSFRAALPASEKCIAAYYANVGCHISKARALIGLGRMSDAQASLTTAQKIIAHRHRAVSTETQNATSAAQRRRLAGELVLLAAQGEHASSLRARYFD